MCMITVCPANIDIPWNGIENGSIFNDDGHGFAIASKTLGLEVFKSMNYDIMAIKLAEARERHGADSIVVVHARFATHGEKTNYNVHPFPVAEDEDGKPITVMAHNGILPAKWQPKWSDKQERRSDTRIFADEVGREYSRNGVPSRRGGKAIGTMIGNANKLVFLTAKDGMPKVRIVNAHQGIFTDGVWYSNSGFEESSWNWRGWSKYDASEDTAWASSRSVTSASATGTTNSEDKVTYMNASSDCSACGEINSIDKAAGICTVCEFCIDCKEYLSNCMCYTPAGKFGSDEEDGGSPLNPQFINSATQAAAANNAALATNGQSAADKTVELWTPYSGLTSHWAQ